VHQIGFAGGSCETVETRGHSSKWTPRTDRLQLTSPADIELETYWKRNEDEPRLRGFWDDSR
jgi:hypothetical protein